MQLDNYSRTEERCALVTASQKALVSLMSFSAASSSCEKWRWNSSNSVSFDPRKCKGYIVNGKRTNRTQRRGNLVSLTIW